MRWRSWWWLLPIAIGMDLSEEIPWPSRSTSPVPMGPAFAALIDDAVSETYSTVRGELAVSPLEHASVLFGWDNLAIYVDPSAPIVNETAFPKADVILLTDVHFDHFDPVVVQALSKPGTVVVGPPALAERTRVDVVLRNGERANVRGIGVTAVPMYNVARGPAPGLLYHPPGRGNGYVLDFADVRVYLSGDTDCTPEVRALRDVDLAFVSAGTETTMSPAEAGECIAAFRPAAVIPYHDRWQDLTPLAARLQGTGVELRARDMYPRAARKRHEAVEFCTKHQWGICRDRLDEARELDPRGEDRPDVRRMRDEIRNGMGFFRIPL